VRRVNERKSRKQQKIVGKIRRIKRKEKKCHVNG
jgi:hypothetical protein